MDDTNRCVCCGKIIPEGRQVCPTCEKEACLHLWVFDGIVIGKAGKRMLKWKCQCCGAERLEKPVDRRIFWEE
jgi:RNA polymerase subunit RPABC4/transcription elongation factor Spt4